MPDAQRFLVVKAAEEGAPLTLVVNWTAELERRRTEGVKSSGIVIHVWHFVIMLCPLLGTNTHVVAENSVVPYNAHDTNAYQSQSLDHELTASRIRR